MNTATISGLVSSRLNEGGTPTFYPYPEILAAVNEGQRLFCVLTLALEKQFPLLILANTTFLHLLPTVPDYLAPLRLTDTSSGAKVRPATFAELWARDAAWPATIGPLTRYVAAGADLVALYAQSAVPAQLMLQYAASPPLLVVGTDVPAIPPEYHQELVNYGIYRLRMVEGGAEFAATLPLLEHFLAGAQEYGDYMRARNVAAGYDTLPFELALFDRSRLVGKSKKK